MKCTILYIKILSIRPNLVLKQIATLDHVDTKETDLILKIVMLTNIKLGDVYLFTFSNDCYFHIYT